MPNLILVVYFVIIAQHVNRHGAVLMPMGHDFGRVLAVLNAAIAYIVTPMASPCNEALPNICEMVRNL